MDNYGRLLFAVVGFASSLSFLLPNLKKWQKQQITREKLRIVKEAMAEAEERLLRLQERHDGLLREICSYYLCHRELEDALVDARRAMDEALDFANALRKMQVKMICSYPDLDLDLAPFERAPPSARCCRP
ncbi:hypothetical protein Nepgr_001573 [Nepenthes gracilis]|uniref:Uncharacterized protein n=1 Tax=Nepenthes gracilis TaxID=150966 RepID=A0AAD3RX45_NEPGR|nr:hypothetical protein Nepgr_001573 [Nepenthes gracilis]